MSRRDDIAASLAAVEHRLRAACEAAGRERESVTLIAVTKTFPESDVAELAALGLREVAESRDQEGRPKAAAHPDLTWHFVGQLQSNKARSVASWASVVQTLDRPELIAPLRRGADVAGRHEFPVLIQVSLDGDPRRGGVREAGVDDLAARAVGAGLRVAGVMAVAPMDAEPLQAFAALAQVSARLRESHPDAQVISAGMSGDLEAAIMCGATHVRIGTALLGGRPLLGH